MTHTPLPKEELELFKFISKDIEVIFDVGARTDTDYKEILPDSICHLFEPSLEFFEILKEKTTDDKGIYLNNYGISDEDGFFHYNPSRQTFRVNRPEGQLLPVRTIESYCKEKNIDKIDFLKTDTEGWDLKVILSAINYWPKIKYIQYEHWNDDIKFRKLLGSDFDVECIGYRNGLAMNKTLLSEGRRQEVIKFIRDNRYGELA